MMRRYGRSGCDKLILLLLSDHDPDGDEIAHSFARSMRDDFGIDIHPIKVALTAEQVERFALPRTMAAKKTSSQYAKFLARHGNDAAYELEAIPPADLQAVLREAIDSVLDVDAYNAEIDAERRDAAFLAGVRETLLNAAKEANLDGLDLDDGGVEE
jgi:hypothetical protein